MSAGNANELKCFDKIGNPINVGDQLVYAKAQGDQLHFGTCSELLNNNCIRVKNMDTKRVSVNSRRGTGVLCIEVLKETNPEFFI